MLALSRQPRRFRRERWRPLSMVPTEAFLYGLEADEELASLDLAEPGLKLYARLEAARRPPSGVSGPS